MQTPRGRAGSWRRQVTTLASRLRAGDVEAPSSGLPPGDLDHLDVLEKTNRAALAERAARLGPVFMGTIRDEPTVCIVGLARCRRFLQQHAAALRVETLDLTSLFPLGFLRAMDGEEHLEYRRRLIRAVRAADADVSALEFEGLAADVLGRQASAGDDSAEAWSSAMTEIATRMLVRVFFGAARGTALHASLVDGFRDLGPYGLVWNPGQRQHAAFERLVRDVRDAVPRRGTGEAEMSATCVVATIADQDELDEIMLGNLIYMVEMGRSDIANFLRWLSRFAATDPALCAEVATDRRPDGGRPWEESLVLEVLRSEQSERLERRLTADVEFDGFRIPAGTPVRMCMWESHHDAATFDDPYTFRPERFARTTTTNDQFSPFGLDHHQCPFGTLTMRIGTGFVRALCAHRPTLVADGPPRRGAYHWEPARQLAIGLGAT